MEELGQTVDNHMPRGQQVLCCRRVCVRVSVKQSAGIFCPIQWEGKAFITVKIKEVYTLLDI